MTGNRPLSCSLNPWGNQTIFPDFWYMSGTVLGARNLMNPSDVVFTLNGLMLSWEKRNTGPDFKELLN